MNTCGSDSQPPIAATGIVPSRKRASDVGPDQHRAAAQPVDPRAGDEPDEQRRDEVEAPQHRDLEGPACRIRIATNGSAIRVTKLPNTEIVAALHTRTNAPLRHSAGVGHDVVGRRRRVERGSAVTARRVPVA